MVPCGGAMNCSAVMSSPFASFMDINVSYIGLAGYVGLFAIAILRSTLTGKTFRTLGTVGFIMSAIGLLFSLYLTFLSLAVLQVKCVWCLSSLAVILVTTIMHAALLQSDAPEKNDKIFGFASASGSLIVALGITAFVVYDLANNIDPSVLSVDATGYTLEMALPDKSKIKGNENAKVTLIEFADINCVACRQSYPLVKEILKEHGNGLRFAFRHFPLTMPDGGPAPGHETSMQAAIVSELAAEKGNFWKYMDHIMNTSSDDSIGSRIRNLNGLIGVSSEIGYSSGEITTILHPTNSQQEDRKDVIWGKVAADITMALDIGVQSTPTFVIYAEGHKPKPVGFNQLSIVLNSPPYRDLIEAGK